MKKFVHKVCKHINKVAANSCLLISIFAAANAAAAGFYFAPHVGFGDTTWDGIVAVDCKNPSSSSMDCAMETVAAPIDARSSGVNWGVNGGYEVNDNFAAELSFNRSPNAFVEFSINSSYQDKIPDMYTAHTEDGDEERLYINSATNSGMLQAKFMARIASSNLRAYAKAGPAIVKRDDTLQQAYYRITPAFGAGLNYQAQDSRLFMEADFQYIAGYGEASMKPAVNYIPFVYYGNLRVGWFFSGNPHRMA